MASIQKTRSSSLAIEPSSLNVLELARAARLEYLATLLLVAPALAVTCLFLVLPVGWLFGLSFIEADALSLTHYQRMVEYGSYLRIFETTFEISIAVTLICVVLGYPVAYLIAQMPARLAAICLSLVIIPFWTSLLVRTYAWLVLLQQRGLINAALLRLGIIEEPISLVYSFTGTLIGMVHIMLPFFILPLYSAIRSFDWDLLRAAASLGAPPFAAFLRVFLPLSAPGLLAGAVLVFIVSLGFYVTPQILGGGNVMMVAMKVASNVVTYFDWGAASALGVVLLVLVLLSLYCIHKVVGIERTIGGVR